MTSNELLTACIPTFNRSELLEEALKDIIPKIKGICLPLIVVDNCSTDTTKEIVYRYMSQYSLLSYFCQEENKGFDINFETALKLSQTEYTWVLGDGDRVNETHLASILDFLSSEKPDLYCVNHDRRVANLASQRYYSAEKFLTEVGWHLTLLSATIYSRSVINKANFQLYRNTNFIHFGIIFDTFANSESFCAYWDAEQVIYGTTLKKQNSWNPYRIIEIFGKAWADVVFSLPNSLPTKAKLYCIRIHGEKGKLFTVRKLLRQRAVGSFSYSIYKKYEKYFPLIAPNSKLKFLIFSIWPNIFNKYYWRYKRTGVV